ncbi:MULTISPECIES: NHL repeat-containing protein [Autumnicola]|jgi:DNA-binding beta-propeller fold protein YncE|uniref:NHL repeat-containing protein n=2 Tax=Autumnicola TaxID=3160927 RepID=A0ABU3CZT8_9FLAO|nr:MULTISPECIES: NHL repeat-containing protein [unclassified Zunongwangia]MDT0651702.1 NHL repeat-containing protein [Zunongwangia sp. F297]MDT0675513.1 NHL repeat-containing protein [Zunongwangia sp. F117]
MNRFILILVFTLLLISCKQENVKWTFEEKIKLPEKVRPLSLAKTGDDIWFSDPEQFRLLKIDPSGNKINSIVGIKRPMNIDFDKGKLYVPEFLTDTIWVFEDGKKSALFLNAEPQAPAGLNAKGDTIAIADFYNHRIILQIKEQVSYIGKEGHNKGELYYPIDVKIKGDKVFVADAYNNRVQVFNIDGKILEIIGEEDGFNVASGIALSENGFAVTDQENSRVLIYDFNGELEQILTDDINYPTDALFDKNKLYITNFKENSIAVYKMR